MNILVLSINYSPEPTGFAPHVAAASKYFVRQGHKVTVITGFPFAPYWKRWPDYRNKFIARETIDGVKVVRLTHFIPRRAGQMIQRLFLESSFCLLAGLVGGMLVGLALQQSPSFFFHQSLSVLGIREIIPNLLVKPALFGLLIGTASSRLGLAAEGGTRAVGSATVRSVVIVTVGVLVTDYLVSEAFRRFWPPPPF